jgi:hypothetical protein
LTLFPVLIAAQHFRAGLYERLVDAAYEQYGTSSKPNAARHVAKLLCLQGKVPISVKHILGKIRQLCDGTEMEFLDDDEGY